MTQTSTDTAALANAVGWNDAAIYCTGRKADGTACRFLTRMTVAGGHAACKSHAEQVVARELELAERRAAYAAQNETTPVLTFEKIANGRHQVLRFGKPIGTVRYESASWWAYDLNGDKIQGGHGTARQAASFLPKEPEAPAYVCEICGEDGDTCAHSLAGQEIETPSEAEQLALDGGVALTAEDWAVVKEVVQLAWKAGLTSHAQEAVLSAMTVAPLKVS